MKDGIRSIERHLAYSLQITLTNAQGRSVSVDYDWEQERSTGGGVRAARYSAS